MDLQEAKELLNGCVRSELQDHAFGDAEVFWSKDGEAVAGGYFGGGHADVYAKNGSWNFNNDDARVLRRCGISGHVERNDETGPDTYSEGTIMPGLTKEAVRKELTGE